MNINRIATEKRATAKITPYQLLSSILKYDIMCQTHPHTRSSFPHFPILVLIIDMHVHYCHHNTLYIMSLNAILIMTVIPLPRFLLPILCSPDSKYTSGCYP